VSSSAPIFFGRVIRVLTLVLLGISLCVGQEPPNTAPDKATVTGTVTDKSGAVVREARAVIARGAPDLPFPSTRKANIRSPAFSRELTP
jgi:hypothetical protein